MKTNKDEALAGVGEDVAAGRLTVKEGHALAAKIEGTEDSVSHSPLPWVAHGRTVYAGESIIGLAVSEYDAERGTQYNLADHLKSDDEGLANAQFVCRAVNSHADLLEALQAISCLMDTDKVVDARRIALAAIAKAKGQV